MRYAPKFVLLAVVLGLTTLASAEPPRPQPRFDSNILADTFQVTTAADADVPLEQIHQGCPARDCIPAIDDPQFLPAAKADRLAADDLVIGIAIAGAVRAYPTFILDHHEIVNDTVAGTPVAITWCPLCGSGLAFERVLDGKPVQFGVSGLLHESDLVMYDRASNSLWQQVSATAIAGPRRGQKLARFPVTMTTWGEWLGAHPDTQVLSTATGHDGDYSNKTPYADYVRSDRILFPVQRNSQLSSPKTVVYGVQLPTGAVAVTEALLRDQGQLDIEHQGQSLHWQRDAAGAVDVRAASGEHYPALRMYWFAWFTFHPDTILQKTVPAPVATDPTAH
ncbi:MAG: hypothetical protein COS34_06710 [Lysobacterales bacterium CG02_land_8_20_14_3_00_62_12]|nr:MAG: hypothetical protein COS34_06710 [Xanthomonadales bacterium CG02_land_8_20_14_3_00_62_12]